jgi:peptide methionine sulfoxide reductase MsrA
MTNAITICNYQGSFGGYKISFRAVILTMTTVDRQSPDIGAEYRSAIFFFSEDQRKAAEKSKAELDGPHVFKNKAVTQILPAGRFYKAEEYHQDYFRKQGGSECHLLMPPFKK